MGVLIFRDEDSKLYADTYEEAQRIIRISDEVRMSLEKVSEKDTAKSKANPKNSSDSKDSSNETNSAETPNYSTLTTAKLAAKLGMKTAELNEKLLAAGYLEDNDGEMMLTDAGATVGEIRKGRFGSYCLWDAELTL